MFHCTRICYGIQGNISLDNYYRHIFSTEKLVIKTNQPYLEKKEQKPNIAAAEY